MVSNTPADRGCDGCNVCCTAMKVTPLNKPAGSDCLHQNETGCGIYSRRPTACRAWYCMWIRDHGNVFSDHHRPDKLGVFFTASAPDARTGQQTIFAHEVYPHAAETPEPQHVIRQLAIFAPVQIVPAPTTATEATQTAPLTYQGQALT